MLLRSTLGHCRSHRKGGSLDALDRGEIRPGKDLFGSQLTDFTLANGATKFSLVLQFDVDSRNDAAKKGNSANVAPMSKTLAAVPSMPSV